MTTTIERGDWVEMADGTLVGVYRVIWVGEDGLASVVEDGRTQPILSVPVGDLRLVRKGSVQ